MLQKFVSSKPVFSILLLSKELIELYCWPRLSWYSLKKNTNNDSLLAVCSNLASLN